MRSLVELEVNPVDRDYVEKRLGALKSKTPVVMSRAINRALITARGRAVKVSGKGYFIKNPANGVKKEKFRIKKASFREPSGELLLSSYRLALAKFRTIPETPDYDHRIPPKYFYAKVKMRSELKKLTGKPGSLSPAFIARFKAGSGEHIGVYQRLISVNRKTGKQARTGGKKSKLKQLYGPSLSELVAPYKKEIRQAGRETVQKRLDHEIRRLIEGGAV